MTAPKFFISFLTISFLASCSSTYTFSDKDYSWMPYKGNETLVFTSNTSDIDTIFFLKKDTSIAYPEPETLNGRTYEVVRIFARHSDPSPPDGNHRYLDNDFVKLEKSKDKKTRLNLYLLAKDAAFYRLNGINIDSLSEQKPTSLATKSKTYTDIFVIDDEDWLNFKQRSNYVTKLYWSKSEGLIRYDKRDGVYWELTKKYSP